MLVRNTVDEVGEEVRVSKVSEWGGVSNDTRDRASGK